MTYWSIAALLVTFSFLAYRHPATVLGSLPRWLRPARRRPVEHGGDGRPTDTTTGGSQEDEIVVSEVKIEVEQPLEAEETPKATAKEGGDAVPTFSLNEEDAKDHKMMPPPPPKPVAPSFPAANSAQRASNMPPPSRPASETTTPVSNGLMPPPSRPASDTTQPVSNGLMPSPARPTTLGPPPSSAAGLRVPSSGPLPNRGPPQNSQQRATGGLSPNGLVATPNKRNKVLLSPGHSPMDWAALIRSSSATLSGVSSFQRVTPSKLKSMNGRKGKPAWSSWQGKVYNITPYLDFHPGGRDELMKGAGRDGTNLFMEVHPWVNWENMLGACLVGVLVPEDYAKSELEDMD
ncbi:hypothetical protein LTR37_004353 [Vermiconidia calcicola]|uniref:Uncharacterized protein n=1 Tax=Vermiconidia calcicola TaxID=1690605 RepID=A0ACC3NN08_9PEZI|nr:hypothetical protein LTR37_004353 [Vermiconidia calcicola]